MDKPKYKVYLSGPISNGDMLSSPERWANVMEAMRVGVGLMNDGFWVHIPHLSQFYDFVGGRKYEDMLQDDRIMVEFCDCLFRLPGTSAGAARESQWAHAAGKDVAHSIPTLFRKRKAFFNGK